MLNQTQTRQVEVEIVERKAGAANGSGPSALGALGGISTTLEEMQSRIGLMFGEGRMGGGRKGELRRMTVKEARPLLEEQEVDKLITQESIVREAVRSTENDGIVFFDEIDKIVSPRESRAFRSEPTRAIRSPSS